MKVLKYSIDYVWRGVIAINSFLVEHCFQPIVDAGWNSWCRRGKGFFIFYIVVLAVISLSIPVMIDETLVEIGKSFSILVLTIIIARFILLMVLRLCISIFSDRNQKNNNHEVAKFVLFACLKAILIMGISMAIFFGIGDIFLTVGLMLFLFAVFFEGCECPHCKVPQRDRLNS